MPDQEYRIGNEILRFPEGTPQAEIDAALAEYTKPPVPPPPVAGRGTQYDPRNVGPNLRAQREGAIENLPTLASIAAALATGGASLPIQAATVGGLAAAGQGAKDVLQGRDVDPASAAWEGAKEAALQFGGGKLAQGVAAAGPYLQKAGVNLLTRIAKPTTTLLRNVGREWGEYLPERAANLSKAFLERGLRITKPAVVGGQIEAAEEKLAEQIAGSTARGSTQPSVEALEAARNSARYQSLPEADKAAFDATLAEYRRNPLLSKVTRSQTTVPTGLVDPQGNPILTTKITRTGRDLLPTVTVQKLQKVKQGTYRSLGEKAWGELGSASREGQKQIARGQAQAIEAAEPKVAPVNTEIGRLIDLRDYAEEVAKRTGNVNPISLGAQVALATKSPVGAAALFERPAFGEPLARSLYRAGGALPTTVMNPAQLYRLMLLAQMQQDDEQQTPPQP